MLQQQMITSSRFLTTTAGRKPSQEKHLAKNSIRGIQVGLPSLSSVREFSTGGDKNDKNDEDTAGKELKLAGVFVPLPEPLSWIKNAWFSYIIRLSVDPEFRMEEFITGAKQVDIAFIAFC